jgi:hypothetical protein
MLRFVIVHVLCPSLTISPPGSMPTLTKKSMAALATPEGTKKRIAELEGIVEAQGQRIYRMRLALLKAKAAAETGLAAVAASIGDMAIAQEDAG